MGLSLHSAFLSGSVLSVRLAALSRSSGDGRLDRDKRSLEADA
jgi:hypothetical protein